MARPTGQRDAGLALSLTPIIKADSGEFEDLPEDPGFRVRVDTNLPERKVARFHGYGPSTKRGR